MLLSVVASRGSGFADTEVLCVRISEREKGGAYPVRLTCEAVYLYTLKKYDLSSSFVFIAADTPIMAQVSLPADRYTVEYSEIPYSSSRWDVSCC